MSPSILPTTLKRRLLQIGAITAAWFAIAAGLWFWFLT